MNRINELVDNNTKWEIKERNRLDQNKIVLDTSLTYLSDREQIVKRKVPIKKHRVMRLGS